MENIQPPQLPPHGGAGAVEGCESVKMRGQGLNIIDQAEGVTPSTSIEHSPTSPAVEATAPSTPVGGIPPSGSTASEAVVDSIRIQGGSASDNVGLLHQNLYLNIQENASVVASNYTFESLQHISEPVFPPSPFEGFTLVPVGRSPVQTSEDLSLPANLHLEVVRTPAEALASTAAHTTTASGYDAFDHPPFEGYTLVSRTSAPVQNTAVVSDPIQNTVSLIPPVDPFHPFRFTAPNINPTRSVSVNNPPLPTEILANTPATTEQVPEIVPHYLDIVNRNIDIFQSCVDLVIIGSTLFK